MVLLAPLRKVGSPRISAIEDCGGEVTTVQKGDRVVVPFPIACGGCFFCNGTQDYTPRPVTSFTTNTITAITKRRWIKPPATWKTEKPRSHNMTRMTIRVQSILHEFVRGLCDGLIRASGMRDLIPGSKHQTFAAAFRFPLEFVPPFLAGGLRWSYEPTKASWQMCYPK